MGLTTGQRQCVDTLDKPLVVAAGAGSGKTFTLTKRIVGAFECGYVTDIDEICAITFTKKAAGELKSRIKAELRACGFIDQALRVDEAWISTIHGMCARMLRAHAIELEIDPAFQVIEGAQVDTYRARAIDWVLTEAQIEDSPRLDALFAEYPARAGGGYGVSVEGMLSSLVEEAASCSAGVDAFVMPGVTIAPLSTLKQAIEVVEGLIVAALEEKESAKRDDWIASTTATLDMARDAFVRGAGDYGEVLRLIAPFKLAKTFGGKEYKARVDEARGMLGACVMEARLGAARVYLETLVDLTRRVLDVYAGMKRADGVVDNNDLLVMAARAIEDYPAIASLYAEKFKLVMVDEFQDTDQMQVDMIKRLAGTGARRLCTVGDAQQSIYRFRGADVSVYRRHLASVQAEWPGSIIKLSDNFRSHGDVLAFVDCVFEKPDMFGGEFMSLAPGRDEARVKEPFSVSAPRIIVQHTTRPWRGVSGSSVVEVAARRIAKVFAALVEEGHAPSEMVVLLGRMTNADVYARALRDEGLACVVSGGSVFSRTLEARVVEQLARVIANPLESQSLFNVLTSPLFALTAGDLLSVDGISGFWRAAFGGECRDESPQLACALRVMAQARGSIGDMPVCCIMNQVVVDSGWLSRLQAQGPEGLASAANVFKALRIVRDIELAGARGPASVSKRFAETLAGSKEAPGALSVSGGDSVRIMTIHASKGLEFPIVAVAEAKESRAPSSRLITSSVAGGVYISLDLGRTLDSLGDSVDATMLSCMRDYVLGICAGEDELAAAVQEDAGALHRRLALRDYVAAGDEEEAKRLLYVALTRAKEALVVSTIGTRTKDNPEGLPKSSAAGVFAALDATGAGFGEGQTICAFGGERPAVVECVALNSEETACEVTCVDSHEDGKLFMVPAPCPVFELTEEPYKPLHDGVFSYSSISDAAHKGDLLDRMSASFAVAVDKSQDDGTEPLVDSSAGRPECSYAAFDDDFWDFDVTALFDEDRATDLGTAFHRLAQYAVVTRGEKGVLAMPPTERIDALSRTCNLDVEQRMRLGDALRRWFGCDLAQSMAELSDLSAEVPFFVAVPLRGEDDSAYLEGEIDLLGFDASHTCATVVDYKTGGRDDETADELRCKHVLQAACYAYAIMLQGVQEVDAVFVRVERPCAHDPAQPQCVRYHFEQGDVHRLGSILAEIHLR